MSAWQGDHTGTINGLKVLNCLNKDSSDEVQQSFARFCQFLLEPFDVDQSDWPDFVVSETGEYDWRNSKLLKRAGKLGGKSMLVKGFSLPPVEFMLLSRKLTGVFTFISKLGAQFNAAPLLQKYQ